MAIGIGETLRAARREKGLSLSDAAEATRIRARYLGALEDDEFEALGEDVYVRGFLRNYARYLGLEPEPLLSEYRASFQPPPEDVPVATPPAVPQRAPLPPVVRTVAAAGALVLLLAVVAVAGDRGVGSPGEEVAAGRPPPVTGGSPVVVTSTPPSTPTPTPSPTTPRHTETAAPASGVEVVLRVSGGPSWLRVVVDGETEVEATLGDGETRTFSGDEVVSLRLGDAGNVHLTVGGQDLGPAGDPGAVLDLEFTAAD